LPLGAESPRACARTLACPHTRQSSTAVAKGARRNLKGVSSDAPRQLQVVTGLGH